MEYTLADGFEVFVADDALEGGACAESGDAGGEVTVTTRLL